MAITVNSAPLPNQPAHNHLHYRITSNNVSEPNFNFVCDVYVGSTLVARQLYPKQPLVNYVDIDISPILRNYVKHNETFSGSGYIDEPQVDYYVQFGEAYDVNDVFTIYPNLLRRPASGTDRAYNSVFDFEEFDTNILDNYKINNYGVLTTMPNIEVCKNDKLSFIYYDPALVVNNVRVSNGITSHVDSAPRTSGKFMYKLDASLLINNLFSYAEGTYVFEFRNSSNVVLSSKTVKVIDCCDKYGYYRLHWLNKLGGWDSFNFNKVSEIDISLNRKEYKRGLSFDYNKSDRLVTRYNTSVKESITLNSDWINDEVGTAIKGLFESPVVYLERKTTNNNYNWIAVNVIDQQYKVRKYSNGRSLKNVTVTIEYAHENYRQTQ